MVLQPKKISEVFPIRRSWTSSYCNGSGRLTLIQESQSETRLNRFEQAQFKLDSRCGPLSRSQSYSSPGRIPLSTLGNLGSPLWWGVKRVSLFVSQNARKWSWSVLPITTGQPGRSKFRYGPSTFYITISFYLLPSSGTLLNWPSLSSESC